MQARGEPLRADDNPEVLKQRLDAYRRRPRRWSAYYRGKGTLQTVDGMAPIDEVTAAIGRALADASPAGCAHRKAGRATKAPQKGRRAHRQPAQDHRAKSGPPKARARRPPAAEVRTKAAAKALPGRARQAGPNKAPDRQKSRRNSALAEVDETTQNPLITRAFSRTCSNDAGPQREGRVSRYRLRTPLQAAESAPARRASRPATGERPWPVSQASIIPTNKRVVVALQYIHGIGQKNAAGHHGEGPTSRRSGACRS